MQGASPTPCRWFHFPYVCVYVCIEEVLKTGFSSAPVNMKSNNYAAGVHFACDPRLAHVLMREQRSAGSVDVRFEILLCRLLGHAWFNIADAKTNPSAAKTTQQVITICRCLCQNCLAAILYTRHSTSPFVLQMCCVVYQAGWM